MFLVVTCLLCGANARSSSVLLCGFAESFVTFCLFTWWLYVARMSSLTCNLVVRGSFWPSVDPVGVRVRWQSVDPVDRLLTPLTVCWPCRRPLTVC